MTPMRVITRTFGYIVVTSFVLSVIGIVVFSVVTRLAPPDAPIWRDVQCFIGSPARGDTACLTVKLREQAQAYAARTSDLEQKIAHVQEEKARIERAITDEDITFVESQYINDDGSLSEEQPFIAGVRTARKVVVGIVYRDGRASSGIDQGWCWATQDVPGMDLRVVIGKVGKDGRAQPVRPSDEAVEKVGWEPHQLGMVRGHCPWPESVS